MRTHLSILLRAALLAALASAPAAAGTVVVDTTARTVDTSRLFLQFDQDAADLVYQLHYKDLSPAVNLTSYYLNTSEFWGQSMRNTSNPGFVLFPAVLTSRWAVTRQSPTFAEITTTTQCSGQPLVTTRYRFFADQPYFSIDRTIGFAAVPDTAAYQPFLPRVSFISLYYAARWRDTTGALMQRGYCATPCLKSGWDRRWVEQMAYVGQTGLAVTSFFAPGAVPAGTQLVDGLGPYTQTGWVAPLVPAGPHAQDVTWSQLVGFSLRPDAYASLDSMWTVYSSGAYLADVPADRAGAALRLSVAPNPSRAGTTIEWTNAAAGLHAIDVLDVAGRRVARVHAGWAAAGRHAVTWDGRDGDGSPVSPGLYFVRLLAPDGTRVARLARAR